MSHGVCENKKVSHTNFWLFCGFAVVFGLAFLRVHYRVQTVLTGYRLGELKQKEAELLERRSVLQMTYAKLTTRRHLELMANDKSVPVDAEQLPLASTH